jgi:PAS domain S-box-containing protein
MLTDTIFRSVVEDSFDTIFRMTLPCDVLYVSPCMRRQLGYELEVLVGSNSFNLIYENRVAGRGLPSLQSGGMNCHFSS